MTDNAVKDEPDDALIDDAAEPPIDDAANDPADKDLADESAGDPAPGDLDRAQKRLLKRLYNGRTIPIIVDDRPFLTYKDALRYLLSLPIDARDSAYAAMKAHSRDKAR